MYGVRMKDALTVEVWLRHGLKVLRDDGPDALKAVPMARALGVSRGSFYWHFKDISQFHEKLLDLWRDLTTQQVIRGMDTHPTAKVRLSKLMYHAMRSDMALERAVRAWAVSNEKAAETIAVVDAERVGYLVNLLAGGDAEAAATRQRALFIYWAYLGRMVTDAGDALAFSESDFEAIVRGLTA